MNNKEIKARKKARTHALQALYQWALSNQDLYEIEAQYSSHFDMTKVDVAYFKELLYNIPKQLSDVDSLFKAFIDREVDELTPIELTVLRIGSYELQHRIDVPFKVAIKEAVSLAKVFGTEEGHRFVNGVLDKVARQLRPSELS